MNNQEKIDKLNAEIQEMRDMARTCSEAIRDRLYTNINELEAEVSRLQSENSQTEMSGSVLGNINPKKENKTSENTSSPNQSTVNKSKQLSRQEKSERAARGSRTITQNEPLVMFVGPASCGKSMVLMSLVEYIDKLSNPDYTIAPNEYYLLHDPQYKTNCETFMKTLEFNTNATSCKIPLDKTVNEILIDVKKGSKNGKSFRCYSMLEAPGEDFFDIGDPGKPYKAYIKKIIQNAPCPIYFVMLLDLHTPNNNFHDPNDTVRLAYERRLIEIINDGYKRTRGDKVILLYNKFDDHDSAISDAAAMRQLFKTYYKKITDTDALHYKVLGERLYPQFEKLPYISGEYYDHTDDEGNTYEVYDTTDRVTRTVEDLWKKIK